MAGIKHVIWSIIKYISKWKKKYTDRMKHLHEYVNGHLLEEAPHTGSVWLLFGTTNLILKNSNSSLLCDMNSNYESAGRYFGNSAIIAHLDNTLYLRNYSFGNPLCIKFNVQLNTAIKSSTNVALCLFRILNIHCEKNSFVKVKTERKANGKTLKPLSSISTYNHNATNIMKWNWRSEASKTNDFTNLNIYLR